MEHLPIRHLQRSIRSTARTAIISLFGVAMAVILAGGWLHYSGVQSSAKSHAAIAADKIRTLYVRSATPSNSNLLNNQLRDYHAELELQGLSATFAIVDSSGSLVFGLPTSPTHSGPFSQSGNVPLLQAPGVSGGTITVSLDTRPLLYRIAAWVLLAALLCLIVLWWALRQLRAHHAVLTDSTDKIVKAFERFEHADFEDSLETNGPLELMSIQSAINHLGRVLGQSRDSLDEQVRNASLEVSQSLEEMEIKNVELDLARRRAVEANHAKSSFLANISHEIRTPMNGIIGHLQLLRRAPHSEQQADYIKRTLQAAHGLLDIIDDTLNLSRIEANKLDIQSLPFNLFEEVNRCVVMQAPAAVDKNLDLYFFCPSSFPETLIGDSLRVRQVVTNLISNSIKYTETGFIRVSLECVKQLGNKQDIILKVSDSGLGMDSAQIDSLFEAFSQAGRSPESGTGLGLLITRSLTEAMGGTLDLVSEIDRGSTFTITLPMQRQGQLAIGKLPVFEGNAHVQCEDKEAQAHYESLLLQTGLNLATQDEADLNVELVVVNQTQLAGLSQARQDLVKLCAARPTPHVVLLGTDNLNLLNRLNANRSCEALPLHSPAPAILDAVQRLLSSAKAPVDIDSGTMAKTSFADEALKLANVRVLLADDDDFGRAYMTDLLISHGAHVDNGINGEEAAALAAQNEYDLVLLDVRMPICDGIEATRRIRAMDGYEQIPIIGITASAVPEQHMNCMQAGMTDYWVKPLKISQLLGGLEHWLIQRSESADAPMNKNHDEVIDVALEDLDDEMLDLLVTEIGVYHARLKDFDDPAADLNQLHELAHKLSGAASVCGLLALKQAAVQLQTTTVNRDELHLPEALSGLTVELENVRERLALLIRT